ncbi:MAG: LytR/AlgR family response regulator transcription factor [Marinicellaceae bacterium]
MIDHSSFFLKNKIILTFSLVFIYGCINAWIESLSTIEDFQRVGIEIAHWEPYSWSFSSFLLTFLLIFYIAKAQLIHPLKYGVFKKHFLYHIGHSIVFSIVHIIGMVLIRKLVYFFHNKKYDFGHWPSEMVYEYRKDVLSYFFILSGIYIYQMIIRQLQGDASIVSEQNNSSKQTDKLLIKKKGKEFIINLNNVSSIESGGNYIYIHSNNEVYPMRSTMNKMLKKLDHNQFMRVHRSYIINLDFIKEIISPENQVYKITMKNNATVPLSRKYRNQLLNKFNT